MKVLSYKKSIWQWIITYKIYHLPFWVAYHGMWWAITVGSISAVAENIIVFSPYSLKSAFYVIFQALGVYFNLYYLIPTYLANGRYVLYVGLLLVTIVVTAAAIAAGYPISAWLSGNSVVSLYGAGDNFMRFFQNNTLLSTVASTTLAMSVKLTKNWIQAKRREQLLQREKLETELKFLKQQFNPHFLFNTINSIFFLIHKNPDIASASLAKFSDLLRHQLYENNDKLILLSKETSYLENFMELEKLRQNDKLLIDLEIDEQGNGHLGIAPFILMTFVENAFKHVSKHDDKSNWIKIRVKASQSHLVLMVANSRDEGVNSKVTSYGGIGLQNVQRRLELLYPDQYKFAIQEDQHRFEINLTLPLFELAASRPLLGALK